MTRKRTDRIKALDAINSLWNKYDETCENIWQDAVSLMAHMLELVPGKKFKPDGKKMTGGTYGFTAIRLASLERDPVVEISDGETWFDFADMPWEMQRSAISEVRDKLFAGVEL